MEEDIKKLSMFLSEKLRTKKQSQNWKPYKRGVFPIIDSSKEDIINWENLNKICSLVNGDVPLLVLSFNNLKLLNESRINSHESGNIRGTI